MILTLLLASVPTPAPLAAPTPAPAAAAAPSSAGKALPEPAIAPKRESDCGYLSLSAPKAAAKGKAAQAEAHYKSLTGFKVLGGPFQLTAPKTEGQVWAYRCTRDTIVPAALDGRVILFLQKPLILTDGPRAGVLQIEKGAFVYNVRKGNVTDVEKDSIQKRLDIFTANYRSAVAAAAKKASAGAAPAATKTSATVASKPAQKP